jgi:hypothetical protein
MSFESGGLLCGMFNAAHEYEQQEAIVGMAQEVKEKQTLRQFFRDKLKASLLERGTARIFSGHFGHAEGGDAEKWFDEYDELVNQGNAVPTRFRFPSKMQFVAGIPFCGRDTPNGRRYVWHVPIVNLTSKEVTFDGITYEPIADSVRVWYDNDFPGKIILDRRMVEKAQKAPLSSWSHFEITNTFYISESNGELLPFKSLMPPADEFPRKDAIMVFAAGKTEKYVPVDDGLLPLTEDKIRNMIMEEFGSDYRIHQSPFSLSMRGHKFVPISPIHCGEWLFFKVEKNDVSSYERESSFPLHSMLYDITPARWYQPGIGVMIPTHMYEGEVRSCAEFSASWREKTPEQRAQRVSAVLRVIHDMRLRLTYESSLSVLSGMECALGYPSAMLGIDKEIQLVVRNIANHLDRYDNERNVAIRNCRWEKDPLSVLEEDSQKDPKKVLRILMAATDSDPMVNDRRYHRLIHKLMYMEFPETEAELL